MSKNNNSTTDRLTRIEVDLEYIKTALDEIKDSISKINNSNSALRTDINTHSQMILEGRKSFEKFYNNDFLKVEKQLSDNTTIINTRESQLKFAIAILSFLQISNIFLIVAYLLEVFQI